MRIFRGAVGGCPQVSLSYQSIPTHVQLLHSRHNTANGHLERSKCATFKIFQHMLILPRGLLHSRNRIPIRRITNYVQSNNGDLWSIVHFNPYVADNLNLDSSRRNDTNKCPNDYNSHAWTNCFLHLSRRLSGKVADEVPHFLVSPRNQVDTFLNIYTTI